MIVWNWGSPYLWIVLSTFILAFMLLAFDLISRAHKKALKEASKTVKVIKDSDVTVRTFDAYERQKLRAIRTPWWWVKSISLFILMVYTAYVFVDPTYKKYHMGYNIKKPFAPQLKKTSKTVRERVKDTIAVTVLNKWGNETDSIYLYRTPDLTDKSYILFKVKEGYVCATKDSVIFSDRVPWFISRNYGNKSKVTYRKGYGYGYSSSNGTRVPYYDGRTTTSSYVMNKGPKKGFRRSFSRRSTSTFKGSRSSSSKRGR